MHVYNIHDAKTNLSRLIEEIVNGGEPFVIAKAGKPLVKVVLLEPEVAKPVRRVGFLKDQIKVPADFDTMGGEAVADMFEGKGE
jgi:prevent-host-death family protein